MAKQRTQRGAATKAASVPVAGDRYTVADLLDDLGKVDSLRLHPAYVSWTGTPTEADCLEEQINLKAGVSRLRLTFDAEGSNASFATWLRMRRAEVAIAVGDEDGSRTNSRTIGDFCDMVAKLASPPTAQVEREEETHFVVMRCWPGFTDAAPIESLNALSDSEAEQELATILTGYVWKNRTAIRERRQAAYQRWVDAIKRQSRTIRGPHRTVVVPRSKSLRHWWREMHGWGTKSTLMRMAVAAGWHNSRWMAADPLFSGRRIFSPRVWLAEVGSSELANAISVHLSNTIPNNETEATQRKYLTPHFSVVPAALLTAAEQATARASLARLIKEVDRTDWANIARPFLSHVGDFVSVWRPNAPSKVGSVKSRTSELEVDLDSSFAVYAGRRYPLTADGAFMLDLLVKAGGDYVPMREHFSKPSDIKKSLAPVIQSLIETGSGKGYRLTNF